MTSTRPTNRWFNRLAFLVVSVYLLGVATVLLCARRIPLPFSPRRALLVLLRGRVRGDLHDLRHVRGHCYAGEIEPDLPSDPLVAQGLIAGHVIGSSIKLYENERILLLAHTSIDEIAALGEGRFLHTERTIYFSTSDGSDPRINGRRYHFVD